MFIYDCMFIYVYIIIFETNNQHEWSFDFIYFFEVTNQPWKTCGLFVNQLISTVLNNVGWKGNSCHVFLTYDNTKWRWCVTKHTSHPQNEHSFHFKVVFPVQPQFTEIGQPAMFDSRRVHGWPVTKLGMFPPSAHYQAGQPCRLNPHHAASAWRHRSSQKAWRMTAGYFHVIWGFP